MDADSPSPTVGHLLAQRAWVRRLARALVADEQRADDVTQDAFAIALARPLERLRDLKPWLAATVRRLAAHQRRADARRSTRERHVARPEAVAGAESALRAAELQDEVARAVLALDEPYRSTILLRYLEERSVDDVAQRMGVPAATVRVRTARGLDELRRRLAREHGSSGSMHALAFLAGFAALRPTALAAGPLAAAKLAPLSTLLTGGLMTKKHYALAALLALVLLPLGLWVGLAASTRAGTETSASAALELAPPDAQPLPPETSVAQAALVAQREPTLHPPDATIEAPRPAALPAGGARITGRIVRGDGRPIAGARVHLFDPELDHWLAFDETAPVARTVVTGTDGRFVVDELRLGGSYGLLAEAEGFAPGYEPARPGAREDWRLSGAGRIHGRVLDARTRAPLSGVVVATHRRHVEGNVCRLELASRSDAQGRYSIAGLPTPSLTTLNVRPTDEVPFELGVPLGAPGDLERDILVAAEEWLEGQVVDPETGAPVPGAALACTLRGTPLARADERGHFRVRAGRGHWIDPKDGTGSEEASRPTTWELHDQPVQLFASADGWCTTRIEVVLLRRSADGNAVVSMLRSGGITGVVLGAGGVPLAGARVAWAGSFPPMRWLEPEWAMPAADSWETRTDERGRFALPRVPWGEIHVAELSIRHGASPELRVGDVLPAGPGVVRELEIRLDQSFALGGSAWLNAERHDAYVYVETPSGKNVAWTQADAEGRFVFAALQPGAYTVKACTADGTAQWSEPLTVQLGAKPLTDLELRIRADFGHVRGRVTRSTGEPLADIVAIAFEEKKDAPLGAMRPIAGMGKSDAQGDFSVRLPPDAERRYEITVFWGQSDYSFPGVQIGREGLAFLLPELVTVELVVVEHASGLAVDALRVAWIDPTTKAARQYCGGQEIPAAQGRLEVQVPKGVVDLLVSSPSKGLKETKVRCLGTRAKDDTVERIQVELHGGDVPVKPPDNAREGTPIPF